MNTANKLTVMRIILVPLFIIFLIYSYNKKNLGFQYAALGIFLLSSITDALDGLIARAFNQKTPLGSFLDPLADKFLLISGFVLLAYMHKLPLFFSIIFVSREIIISAAWFTFYVFTNQLEVKSTFIGKFSTALEMMIIILFLVDIKYKLIRPLIWLGVLVSIYSAFDYIFKGSKLIEDQRINKK
jgi:CDP-diacylglycerol--glycerol-3-phosphate 3-phosphatidyltransferase